MPLEAAVYALRRLDLSRILLQVTGRWRYAGPSVAMAKAIEEARTQPYHLRFVDFCRKSKKIQEKVS